MTAVVAGALVRVAALEDVPPGAVIAIEVEGRQLALVNDGGSLYAVQRDCTHAAGPLTEAGLTAGCLLQCPWHGAVFDARTGQVRRGPARKPLQTYPVEIADGAVLVAVARSVPLTSRDHRRRRNITQRINSIPLRAI